MGAIVDAVVFVHGASACLVPWAAGRAIWCDIARHSACVGDVDVLAVRRKSNTVGLLQRIVNDSYGASGRVKAVGCRGQLRGSVSEAVEPGVFRVCEPDRAGLVDKEVIDAVEVVAEIIVKKSHSLIRVRVKCPNSGALLSATNGVVAARGRLEPLAKETRQYHR